MSISVILILSHIFVAIMLLYDVNLYVASLFSNSSFTFLAVLE